MDTYGSLGTAATRFQTGSKDLFVCVFWGCLQRHPTQDQHVVVFLNVGELQTSLLQGSQKSQSSTPQKRETETLWVTSPLTAANATPIYVSQQRNQPQPATAITLCQRSGLAWSG